MKNHQFPLKSLMTLTLVACVGFALLHERHRVKTILAHREALAVKERETVGQLSTRVAMLTQKNSALEADYKNYQVGRADEAAHLDRLLVLNDPSHGALPPSEQGYLDVRDPRKVYLRRIPSADPTTVNYRVYLPPRDMYFVRLTAGRERRSDSSPRLFGRFTMSVQFTDKQVKVRFPRRQLAAPLERLDAKLLDADVDYAQREFSPNAPVTLLSINSPVDSDPPLLSIRLVKL